MRLFSKVFLIIACLLLFTNIGLATDYYVDSSVTDTNYQSATPDFTTYDHLTFATTGGTDSVFATVADVNAVALAAGDNVYFRRGQIWREALLITHSGSAGSPITYTAFGAGELPKIYSVFKVNGADWRDYDVWKDIDTWYSGNGSFEIGTEPTNRWSMGTALSGGSTCAQDTGEHYHGNKSLKLYKANGGSVVDPGMGASFKPWGAKYKLRFYGKTDASANIDLRFQITDNGTNYYLQSDGVTWSTSPAYWFPAVIPANTANWTEYTRTYTLPTSGTSMTLNRVSVRVADAGPATAYIDYFRMEELWQTEVANKYKIYLYNGTVGNHTIIIDGIRATWKTSIANLTTDKDYYYDATTGYYYVYNAVSPELDSRNFEFPMTIPSSRSINSVYSSGQSYFVLDSLALRGGDNYTASYYGNLHFENCDHFSVTNCQISGGDGCGICWASSASHNSIDGNFINNNISQHGGSGGGIMIGRNSDVQTTTGFLISGNNIHHIGMNYIDLTKDGHAIGLFGSSGAGGTPWSVGNGVIENTEISYSGQYAVGAEIGLYNAYSVVIKANNIHHCQESGPKMGTGCKDMSVYNNVIWKNVATDDTSYARGGIVVDWSTGGPSSVTSNQNINIFNNTICWNDDTSATHTYGHRAGILLRASGGGSLINIVAKNNLVLDNYNSTGTYGHQLYTLGTLTSCVLNYNCYYATDNVANFIYYVDTLYSLAQFATYQSGKSQDANSKAVAPELLNASGTLNYTTDYQLKSTSPCLEKGVALTIVYEDYWKTPRPQGLMDIGAYEMPTNDALKLGVVLNPTMNVPRIVIKK